MIFDVHFIPRLTYWHFLPPLAASPTTSQQAAQLHQEMIALFERELVLDIVMVVGQEMELRENAQYNLLMMEILHHILKGQDPMAVAKHASNQGGSGEPASSHSAAALIPAGSKFSSSSVSVLSSRLKQERALSRNLATVRHGHFGGTWMQKQGDKRQFVSASAAVQSGAFESQSKHLVQSKRKNRMAEPFVGFGKTLTAHTRLPAVDNGPSTKRANKTLNTFCQRFMEDCYGPFMKSLKNEFRRDSVRLEESDHAVFFRLVWFFSQWWRASSSSRSKAANGNHGNHEAVGRLIITMDVFTFNLVLNATETFYNHKKYARLAQAVALYSEMMHLLEDMYRSKDKTEHEMAMGLIDRLFYGQEALDQVPKLISRWTPGTYSREYLCDLVEVIHVSLKLLEANTKKGIEHMQKKSTAGTKEVSQKIAKMMNTAAYFDIRNYLVRKIVSNQMITMYGHLMSQYKVNATIVNHRIISMCLRLMRVEIASPDIADTDTPLNPLGTKRSTLEPMLYNLQVIMTMDQILNDSTIRGDKDFESLIQFCTTLMHKFWTAAETNPMLYVEALFRHVIPHRFCELVTNLYVDEDLRMLSERAVLLEEHYQLEEECDEAGNTTANRSNDHEEDHDDDEEGELEFTGDAVDGAKEDAIQKDMDPDSDEKEHAEEDENESCDGSDGTSPSGSLKNRDGEEESVEVSTERREKRKRDVEDSPNKQSRLEDAEMVSSPESQIAQTTGRENDNDKEDDSSDEEINFGISNASSNSPTASKAKLAIEDDSDEDD